MAFSLPSLLSLLKLPVVGLVKTARNLQNFAGAVSLFCSLTLLFNGVVNDVAVRGLLKLP